MHSSDGLGSATLFESGAQGRFCVESGEIAPKPQSCPPKWHETPLDEFRASVYRCKRERSVAFFTPCLCHLFELRVQILYLFCQPTIQILILHFSIHMPHRPCNKGATVKGFLMLGKCSNASAEPCEPIIWEIRSRGNGTHMLFYSRRKFSIWNQLDSEDVLRKLWTDGSTFLHSAVHVQYGSGMLPGNGRLSYTRAHVFCLRFLCLSDRNWPAMIYG